MQTALVVCQLISTLKFISKVTIKIFFILVIDNDVLPFLLLMTMILQLRLYN